MKIKFNRILSLSALVLSFAFVGCGDSLLDDLNENTSVSEGDESGLIVAADYKEAGGMFLTAQRKMQAIDDVVAQPHEYQAKNNLYIDNFAGYTASTQRFGGNLPSTYRYFKEYAEGPKYAFFKVAQSALPVVRSAEKLGLKELGAICSIIYCYSALELADIYGPFPWSDYKNDKQESPLTYTSVKEIYDYLFVDLKEAEAVLANFKNTSEEHQDSIYNLLKTYDRLFFKNGAAIPVTRIQDLPTSEFVDETGKLTPVENWRRLANSIRLRMAVRMSNVAPDRAREEAKAAYESGLITSTVTFNDPSVSMHPLHAIFVTWNDTRVNASYENILKRLSGKDKESGALTSGGIKILERLFTTNINDINNPKGEVALASGSEIVGVRTGIPLTDRDDANQYTRFSVTSEKFKQLPVTIFKMSEIWFLMAEAKLRWDDVIEGNNLIIKLYNNGIDVMFEDFGLTKSDASEYKKITSDDINDIDYYDYSLSEENKLYKTEGLVNIGVKYAGHTGDKAKQMLEMIITQKWIANFPSSVEAWNDLRRTGYPRIFVQTSDIGDGTIEKGKIIRRLPWDESDLSMAADIISSGLGALSEDNPKYNNGNYMNTRLWWDVEDPAGLSDNFRF